MLGKSNSTTWLVTLSLSVFTVGCMATSLDSRDWHSKPSASLRKRSVQEVQGTEEGDATDQQTQEQLRHLIYSAAQSYTPDETTSSENSNPRNNIQTNKRNYARCGETLPAGGVCTRMFQMCHGFNHPNCALAFPDSTDEDVCTTRVRCNYRPDEYNNSGLCFAIENSFVPPRFGPADLTTFLYSFILDLFDRNGTRIHQVIGTGTKGTNMLMIHEAVQQRNTTVDAYLLRSAYNCGDRKICHMSS